MICDVFGYCTLNLPYSRCQDLIRIMLLAVENLKFESIAILEAGFGSIIEKAIQTPMQQSNISDIERAILDADAFLVRLVLLTFDVLGPVFIYNPTFAPMIDPILKWLLEK